MVILKDNQIIRHAIDYVRSTTGMDIGSVESLSAPLPPFLAQLYHLYVMRAPFGRFLLIQHIGDEPITPAKYEKHLARIMKTAPDCIGACVVFESLPFYVRQRYAHRGIAFIVPGKQLNWPQLGLALQQRSWSTKGDPQENLSPATQLVLLYAVITGIPDPTPAKAIAQRLSYSTMTISRVFDQLAAHDVGNVRRRGRERVVSFNGNRRELWHRIHGLLNSPVGREIHVMREQLGGVEQFPAGETALAGMSPLVEPPEMVCAVSPGTWQARKDHIDEIPVADESTCTLQVWRYDPAVLATDGVVDSFSLWLSLRNTHDERLQLALDDLTHKEEGWKISPMD